LVGRRSSSKVRSLIWRHLVRPVGAGDPAFCKWARGKLNDMRAVDVSSPCQPFGRPISKPAQSASGPSQSPPCWTKAKSAMRCQKGKCGSVPLSFAQAPALKPVAQAGSKFSPVGFAALITFNLPTPTHVSELALPMMISLFKACLAVTPWRINDPSGRSRCTDQKLQSSATDARARVVTSPSACSGPHQALASPTAG
jgi:hypothetical protein